MAHTKFQKLLAQKILANRKKAWEWFCARSCEATPPFYSSIDLRDAGFKIAPVDSNLFPAGFNNICPEDVRASKKLIQTQIARQSSALGVELPKRILILPEFHTQNKFYIENLASLRSMIQESGFEVEIGWHPDEKSDVTLTSESGKTLLAHPVSARAGKLVAGEFEPDLILLNNDFSGGYPKLLDEISQPVIPSHRLGWHTRKKSTHFKHYNDLATEFAELIGVDPWLLTVASEEVAGVNFNESVGIDSVAEVTRKILAATQACYTAHGVSRKPFVFVKNNSGTYGMGIMVVHSESEVTEMNRRTKNKMSVGKNKAQIESVLVQEGVPTATLVDRLPSEPVIYLMGLELLGGFLRTNSERGDEDNLNSQGMVFRKLCMSDLTHPEDDDPEDQDGKKEPVLELVYGTIARISALATGRELAEL